MESDCDIQIKLDKREPVYQPDEPVTGTVRVNVNEDCACEDLTLVHGWYTHGDGDSNGEIVDRQSLFQGDWEAGRYYTYDFETTFPPGPYTYHGNYLNVDWRLKAEADISWAEDPTAVQNVHLEPSGTEQSFRGGDPGNFRVRRASDEKGSISWIALVAGCIFLGVGGLFGKLFLLMAEDLDEIGAMLMIACLTLLCSGIGIFALYKAFRDFVAEMRLGNVDVSLTTRELNPGDSLRCHVDVNPSGTIELNDITVSLHGYERVRWSMNDPDGGTDSETLQHTVHEETKTIEETEQATIRGTKRTFSSMLVLPPSAPYSFHAEDNELRWDVRVHIDVPSWPDWKQTEVLTVCPGRP